MSARHFVSNTTQGETCGMCARLMKDVPATHKIGEEFPPDLPTYRHNFTQYVCCEHFGIVLGPMAAKWCAS